MALAVLERKARVCWKLSRGVDTGGTGLREVDSRRRHSSLDTYLSQSSC